MVDEDPNYILLAEDDGSNGEEDIESEDDDDGNSEGDDMDDFGEENDDEESGNDEDDDKSISDEKIKNMEIFIRTFHNGDYDTEFEAALSVDRRVTLPVRPTQASYNKPDNWIERNRIGLEEVKRQLQSCIHSVSRHNKNLDLHLIHNSNGDQLLDNEEPIVWHEPIFDEYWDRLEANIKQQEIVSDMLAIQIENVEIRKERLATLVTALSAQVSTIEYIYFINVNLCQEGIRLLSKLVDNTSQLNTLNINHNRIDNMESARCLSRSLKSHDCVYFLHLAHCNIGSSPEILSVILQSDVKWISLEHNNIDSMGAVTIAKYLESDPPIHRIDLDHNGLNDDDAVLISQALKRNTNLKTINLHSNNLTSIGVKALLSCVFDSSSLNAISESNHSLKSLWLFLPDHHLLQDCNRLLELDWTEKIVLALQDMDSLLQYLAIVPVELIPEVLAFPLRQVGNERQHRHLSIVYSTMRWWNMPMLYSYHKLCGATMPDRKRNRDDQ
jgi:hypothetical protein